MILCNAGSYPPNNSVTSQKISIFRNTLQDLSGHQPPPQCSKFKHFTDLMHCQSLVADSSSYLPIELITFSHHINIRLYHLPNATGIQILLYTYSFLKLSIEISVASQQIVSQTANYLVMPHINTVVGMVPLLKREPRNRPRRTHRVSGGIAQLFLNLGTRRGCVVSITPRPPLPPGKTWYPLYRRVGGSWSRSGWVRKISPHRDSIPGPSTP